MSSYAVYPGDMTLYGLPAGTLYNITDPEGQAALDAASNEVDDYLADKYTLPLVKTGSPPAYPTTLVAKVVQIAQWNLLSVRGFNPEAGSHVVAEQRWKAALDWCKEIAKGQHGIAGVVDSSAAGPGLVPGGPFVVQAVPAQGINGPTIVTLAGSPRARGW